MSRNDDDRSCARCAHVAQSGPHVGHVCEHPRSVAAYKARFRQWPRGLPTAWNCADARALGPCGPNYTNRVSMDGKKAPPIFGRQTGNKQRFWNSTDHQGAQITPR